MKNGPTANGNFWAKFQRPMVVLETEAKSQGLAFIASVGEVNDRQLCDANRTCGRQLCPRERVAGTDGL
jgi:hypothetical protein